MLFTPQKDRENRMGNRGIHSKSFLDYWVNDVPAIGLYQANMTYLYNKNVRTYSDSVRLVTGLDRFSDVNNYAVNKASFNKTP